MIGFIFDDCEVADIARETSDGFSGALVEVENLISRLEAVILEPKAIVLGFYVVGLDGTDLLVQAGDYFSSPPKFIRIIPNSDERFEILGLGAANTQRDLLQGSDEDEHHRRTQQKQRKTQTCKGRKPRQKLFAMRQ